MQDSKHRNYNYVPVVSKQMQIRESLAGKITIFIKSTKLKPMDWELLNKLLKKLEQENDSVKVLRSIEKKFVAIQKQYQK